MKQVKIPQRISDNFADGFNKFLFILKEFNKLDEDESIILDFSKCK